MVHRSCNTLKIQRCVPKNAQRVKSAIIALTGGAACLWFYQKKSMYFHFKVLDTVENNMSRIFRIVLFSTSFHSGKHSLCSFIKICFFCNFYFHFLQIVLQFFKLDIYLIKSSENTHVWLQFVANILLWNFR